MLEAFEAECREVLLATIMTSTSLLMGIDLECAGELPLLESS
jgi:hypothetical protein